jgi:hypothetical protein
MAKKTKVTGKGVLVFPHLNTADFKYKKETGEYSTKFRQDDTEGASLKAEIDALMVESLKEAQAAHAKALAEETDPAKKKKLGKKKIVMADNPPYDEDEEAGTITFNFKMAASGVSRKDKKPFTQAPLLVDAKLKTLDPAKVKIGGGSVAKVSYEAVKFYTDLVGAGVTLRLYGVQILELKEWSRDGASLGFGSEEGGFEAEEETAPAAAAGFTPEETEEEDEKTDAPAATGGKKDDDF